MKDRRYVLANSFPLREVTALLELHACVLRGGDGRHLAQSAAMCNVARKFKKMQAKYAEAKAKGLDVATVDDVPTDEAVS